jgi:hypothetical protein
MTGPASMQPGTRGGMETVLKHWSEMFNIQVGRFLLSNPCASKNPQATAKKPLK